MYGYDPYAIERQMQYIEQQQDMLQRQRMALEQRRNIQMQQQQQQAEIQLNRQTVQPMQSDLMPNPTQSTMGPAVIFVTSVEEAKSRPLDFSGNPVIMYDKETDTFYAKQFNVSSGTVAFEEYPNKTLINANDSDNAIETETSELTEELATVNPLDEIIEEIRELKSKITEMEEKHVTEHTRHDESASPAAKDDTVKPASESNISASNGGTKRRTANKPDISADVSAESESE